MEWAHISPIKRMSYQLCSCGNKRAIWIQSVIFSDINTEFHISQHSRILFHLRRHREYIPSDLFGIYNSYRVMFKWGYPRLLAFKLTKSEVWVCFIPGYWKDFYAQPKKENTAVPPVEILAEFHRHFNKISTVWPPLASNVILKISYLEFYTVKNLPHF